MKRILLYSGWQTCNIGDIGHTPGTLRFLENFVPEAELTVCLIRSNPAVRNMLEERFPRVRFLEMETAPEDELGEAFEASDLVIQNSGMHYNRFYNLEPELLRRCVREGKRFGLYGQSFDGFDPRLEAECITLLSQAEFVFCRDGASLAYLRRTGVAPGVLDFGPDGCFGIDVRDDTRAEKFLTQAGLEAGKFLVVVPRSNRPASDSRKANMMNPRVLTPALEQEQERWMTRLRETIVGWVRATGRPVLLSPEVDKEIEAARELIFERLPEDVQELVRLRATFWNVDEAASVLARARAVVAMEPHSCIIALANGVPAIHYFSAKHGIKAGMFGDIGLSCWLHNIETVSAGEVVARLVEIDGRPDEALALVGRAMNFVTAKSAMMAEAIRASVGLSAAGKTLQMSL